ncbi:hypothetical protein K435DRAFT_928773 [Dendrothele bispora CBS 962.96]|uniref:Uncharacterized protein n=1 Tax=Dendrothele bispora (strain CBS 962.96) TaxID=1314807 RepID=A0A4S8L6D8_DENBC|nr:hypothetical protein K435DRAFT_928773 [Dendrothele bispora CBS 962.96]
MVEADIAEGEDGNQSGEGGKVRDDGKEIGEVMRDTGGQEFGKKFEMRVHGEEDDERICELYVMRVGEVGGGDGGQGREGREGRDSGDGRKTMETNDGQNHSQNGAKIYKFPGIHVQP